MIAHPEFVNMLATSRVQSALRLLLEAHECARALRKDSWQFAVEVECLRSARVTNSDLRWLVCQGYLIHGWERTQVLNPERVFRPARSLAMNRRSCFVLTAAGLEITRQDSAQPGEPSQAEGTAAAPAASAIVSAGPHWDEGRRALYWCGRLVKRYRYDAPNQEWVLKVFQSRGWARCVEVALQDDGGGSYKERLHDTIKNLNRSLRPLLRFRQEGAWVSWEAGNDVPQGDA